MLLRRGGFTLVELLVVIAIIGILVALLLPAIQASREAARRTECVNNMKQIGLALQNYHDTHACFPPGGLWQRDLPWVQPPPPQPNLELGGVLVALLPYVEQQALWESIDFDGMSEMPGSSNTTHVHNQRPDGTKPIRSHVIDAYVCPSDTNSDLNGDTAVANYGANYGPTGVGQGNPNSPCPNNYNSFRPFASGHGQDYPAGPFTRRGMRYVCRISDVTDGLSNVIFFGEKRRGCSAHNDNGWARSNNGQGLCTTLIPINYDSCGTDYPNSVSECWQKDNWVTEFGYKSRHPGGAQFLLGDGSVHLFSESIDHMNYNRLGQRDDGESTYLP